MNRPLADFEPDVWTTPDLLERTLQQMKRMIAEPRDAAPPPPPAQHLKEVND